MVDGIFCLQLNSDTKPFFRAAALDGRPNMLTEAEALHFVVASVYPGAEIAGAPGPAIGYHIAAVTGLYHGYEFVFDSSHLLLGEELSRCFETE